MEKEEFQTKLQQLPGVQQLQLPIKRSSSIAALYSLETAARANNSQGMSMASILSGIPKPATISSAILDTLAPENSSNGTYRDMSVGPVASFITIRRPSFLLEQEPKSKLEHAMNQSWNLFCPWPQA